MTLLGRGLRKVATGNSDSHSIRFQLPGYPRTYVAVADGSADPLTVIHALRAGRAFVTNGPFVEASIEGRGPGERVSAEDGRVRLHVRVRAAPWIDVRTLEVFVGVSPAVTRPVPDPSSRRSARRGRPAEPPVLRFDAEIDLAVADDTFVVVRVRGHEPMDRFFGKAGIRPLAFTNPIFVDGDGDGSVPWLPDLTPTPTGTDAGASRAPDAGAPRARPAR
jgi:hypothetical protein